MTKRRRGAYRKTPARAAALRKAQLASARKRRKRAFVNGAKVVGVVATGVAVHAANHHLNYAATHPVATYQKAQKGVAWAKAKLGKNDPNAPKLTTRRVNPTARRGAGYGPGHRRVRSAAHGTRIRSRVR